MPIASGDYVARLSGGSGNASGSASLGGAKSSTVMPTSVDQLFDTVDSVEAGAGDIEYRCIYLHNASASTALGVRVWVGTNTPSANTTLEIGVGTSAVNGTEQTIANESTAPSGVTFSAPSTQVTGLVLGDIPAGQHRAIWLRRTVTAGAAPLASDGFTLGFWAEFTS